jgi:hypothetical protein
MKMKKRRKKMKKSNSVMIQIKKYLIKMMKMTIIIKITRIIMLMVTKLISIMKQINNSKMERGGIKLMRMELIS